MHIGLVIYGSLAGQSGGYMYDEQLVAGLERMGHRIRIISQKPGTYAGQLLQSLRPEQTAGLDLLIQDELNHPSCAFSNRKLGIPVISLVHHLRASEIHPGLLLALYRSVERRYLRTADGFIFNSRTTERSVRELAETDAPGLVAYPSGARCGTLSPEAVEARLSRHNDNDRPLRLLFVGNLIPRKNLGTLLRALAACPPEIELEVVGDEQTDPRHARRMHALAQTLGLQDQVRFRGRLNDQELSAAFSDADALVVPSEYEGFGMVYLEAFAHGLPAVGSRSGAAGEIITDNENGYLVDPQGVTELAEKLARLTDRRRLSRFSLQARESFTTWPGWETTIAAVDSFLRSFG